MHQPRQQHLHYTTWSAVDKPIEQPLTDDDVRMVQLVALKDVSSTECALIYSMEPVLGAGFAFMALGERWGPTGWLGAGLIVASSLTGQILGSEDDPAAPSVDADKSD